MNAEDKKKLEEVKQKIIERNKKNKDKNAKLSKEFLDKVGDFKKKE